MLYQLSYAGGETIQLRTRFYGTGVIGGKRGGGESGTGSIAAELMGDFGAFAGSLTGAR